VQLRFTTDGSEPTRGSPLYDGPVPVFPGSNTTLAVRGFMGGFEPSIVASGIFKVMASPEQEYERADFRKVQAELEAKHAKARPAAAPRTASHPDATARRLRGGAQVRCEWTPGLKGGCVGRGRRQRSCIRSCCGRRLAMQVWPLAQLHDMHGFLAVFVARVVQSACLVLLCSVIRSCRGLLNAFKAPLSL